ncbi:hypothetical protein V1478_017439 [Vespula squamosa]|uniref:Uncharacterized protein n=1 Tax=Vespula squamosa TaxID=30214 RepID=A0ABD1ZWV0_VESSQ
MPRCLLPAKGNLLEKPCLEPSLSYVVEGVLRNILQNHNEEQHGKRRCVIFQSASPIGTNMRINAGKNVRSEAMPLQRSLPPERCHYSCLTCSGATDGECTTCHSDSNLLTNFGETQCVLQNLAWRFESTMWFYWLTIFFSINALIVVLAMIYVGVNWYIKRSHSSTYDYSKVAYSSNDPMEVYSPMGIQSTVLMEMKRTEEETWEEKELENIY